MWFEFLERFPSRPYIEDGHPGNVAVLMNDTAVLTCPPITDLEPVIKWYKFRPEEMDVKTSEKSVVLNENNTIKVKKFI